MSDTGEPISETWRSLPADLTDEEWELIADLVPTFSSRRPGKLDRPAKHAKRDIVDAIGYVAATGCQWRALPERYPDWNTVHRHHLARSRDGTWTIPATHAETANGSDGAQSDHQPG